MVATYNFGSVYFMFVSLIFFAKVNSYATCYMYSTQNKSSMSFMCKGCTHYFHFLGRSTGSSASFRSESPEMTDTTLDMSAYNTQQLHEYLQEFTKRRRSSMYLRSVQSQMNKYFTDGQKTHMIDVTSPGILPQNALRRAQW